VLFTFAVAFVMVLLSRNQAVALAEHNAILAGDNDRLFRDEADQRRKAQQEAQRNATLAQQNENLAKRNQRLADDEHAQRLATQRESSLRVLQQAFNLCRREGQVPQGLVAMTHALDLAHKAEAEDLQWAIRSNLADWGKALVPLRQMLDHGQPAFKMAFSEDDSTIVTTSFVEGERGPEGLSRSKGSVRFWDGRSGQPRTPLLDLPAAVDTVRISPNGQVALVIDNDGAAHLLDAHTGKSLVPSLRARPPRAWPSFSPDSARALQGRQRSNERTAIRHLQKLVDSVSQAC
jgi:hypothetical protein